MTPEQEQSMQIRFSVIVPVYNRPDEVSELLESLTHQSFKNFEVIIVEDGSNIPCKDVCLSYENALDIKYFEKKNSGPGQSRNYGAERASGVFLLIYKRKWSHHQRFSSTRAGYLQRNAAL